MFGYVKIAEDELRVREWKVYKSYYCSLCRNIAIYSQLARLMLSYDMVFFALLIEAVLPPANEGCKRKLFRKCKKECADKKLDYIAAISVILLYLKLQNDYLDGEKKKRYIMYAIESGYKKASATYPEIASTFQNAMSKLYGLENQKFCDFLMLEHAFSDCFAEVFMQPEFKDEFAEIRGEIAYHVAAWVYWFDMYLDVEKDRKRGDFNAILFCGNENKNRETVKQMILGHVSKAEELLQALPYSSNLEIVQNIISVGIPVQMRQAELL